MYSKLTKDKVMRQSPRPLSAQEISRNQSIHEALKAELTAELKQKGTLGREGRLISTSSPRLKARLVRT
ncbi:hypothetical protein ACSST1_22410 [Pantoea agglomerans]|uniref:hypothetical protein n=1 Tax=Pantoea TaxID=53335 RepID=UPI00068EE853|nr:MULTISPECIES: hypothetical protein [Pantoea]KOA71285.1 hypothetical protein AFL22_06835 [Pantoea sp. CFSAN033090]NYB31474.1 hypothetical protein [Pantoea agglomerans]